MPHFSPDSAIAPRQALLRPPCPHDAALLGAALAGQLPCPFPDFAPTHAPHWIDRLVHRQCACDHLLLIDPGQDRLLGIFSVSHPWDDGRVEVGYWLHGAARGQGLATRTLRTLLGELAARQDVTTVSLRIAAHNAASIRLARRCGFQLERCCAGMCRYVWETHARSAPC